MIVNSLVKQLQFIVYCCFRFRIEKIATAATQLPFYISYTKLSKFKCVNWVVLEFFL